eukprot:Phypoly_transcript_14313.p2 GENE.Phypoly_transcript_14313~~Phypoly_transcript_14313.p2  ORF type:complete len:200 (-),score=73.15 Phypoly_transcript_14313:403-951(-)
MDTPKECPAKEDAPAEKTEQPAPEKKEAEKEEGKEGKDEEKDVKVSESEEETLKQEPKRARSAYAIFTAEQVPMVKKEHPDMSRTEITKCIAAKWKAMTAEQKQPFEEQAVNEKKRIKEAKEAAAKEAKDKEAEKPAESEVRYSLRNSTVIKDGEELVNTKKRALETEEDSANKKKCVTSEE